MMIKIQNLSKSYILDNKSFYAIKDINLELKEGEISCIIGPSGAGKTTLLRCIAGLEEPSSGKIIFKKDCKRTMVFQQFHLFSHLNVINNISIALIKVLKIDKEKAYERARKLLALVGLLDKEKSKVSHLSGGQKQKVAIARALAIEPEILCFDEPTSALDPKSVDELYSIIKSLKGLGITILIITHQMDFANKIADKIIKIDKGLLK